MQTLGIYLVGGGGEDEQLVPLVGEEPGVQLHGDLGVEGEAPGPLHQLEHDPVPDAAQLVRQLTGRVVQQVRYVLKQWVSVILFTKCSFPFLERMKDVFYILTLDTHSQGGNIFKVITVN